MGGKFGGYFDSVMCEEFHRGGYLLRVGNGDHQISLHRDIPVARCDFFYVQKNVVGFPAPRGRPVQSTLKIDVFLCVQHPEGIIFIGVILVCV